MKTKQTELMKAQANMASLAGKATQPRKILVDDCFFRWEFTDGTHCKDVYAAWEEKRIFTQSSED